MKRPLVSILIPFKNTSEFLSECLQSIIDQEYPHWEVLGVDDHSTDKSLELVTLYSKIDPRIRVFQGNGNGIIEALRLAYARSNGELITRMDSDDIMAPIKLQTMVDALAKKGKGHLAVGQVTYFSKNGVGDGYRRYEHWLNQLTKKGENFSEIYKECVIPSPCWMVYREDLETCNAFRPNQYPEDYDLAFRFREAGLKTISCDKVLHFWRDYDTRTSRTSEHYAQNYFLDIKLHHFLKLDYDPQRPLVIWGAGKKGKSIAKGLIDKGIFFEWICDNPNKIGKSIYGIPMKAFKFLDGIENPQSIITVANGHEQASIRTYLANLHLRPMVDYFFFC
ncbi:MAG: glycosyltransferase family 2 protein [Flavobacteriaceae bacterium]